MRLKWLKTSEFDSKPYHLPEFRKIAQTSARLQRLTTTKPPKSTESALHVRTLYMHVQFATKMHNNS